MEVTAYSTHGMADRRTVAPRSGLPFGEQLRYWRVQRRLSQQDLAVISEVSTRHLSFLETGKSRPSREMVIYLAEHLKVPLGDRNSLLLSAGFSPAYRDRQLDDSDMAIVRESLERVLIAHDPYPAIVIDDGWNRLLANEGILRFLDGVAPFLLDEPVNVLRIALHPEGMALHIANLAEWSQHLLQRLRSQIARANRTEHVELLDELSGYPGVVDRPIALDDLRRRVALPMVYKSERDVLSLLSTSSVFSASFDTTLAEVHIESFYPADESTRASLLDRR
jgi:transcriptional regulator with XRE-family HTH domain